MRWIQGLNKVLGDKMNNNLFIQLFSYDGYITTSKLLIKKLGPLDAIMFCELCSEHNYWAERDFSFNGWFKSDIAHINNVCNISEHTQRKIIKKLERLNILNTKKMGLPATRHFKINVNAVLKLFENSHIEYTQKSCSQQFYKKPSSSSFQSTAQALTNIKGYIKCNNNINNNISSSTSGKIKSEIYANTKCQKCGGELPNPVLYDQDAKSCHCKNCDIT